MKRTLSLVLALVMLLGTIPVFAAEVDERIAFLEAEGLLKGNTAGDLMLENELKRQDSVVVLARLLGLEEAALAYEGEFPWEDAKADPFYFGFLAWAYEEGLYKGHSDEKFGFNETITANDFALVLLRALGYGDTEWEDAFEKAEELGLVEGLDVEATDKLLRSNMAIMMYLALETEMAEGGKTLAEELGVEMPTVEMTVAATGRKKLTVTFNKAVTGATFAVNKGNVVVNYDSAVMAEDGKSAVITTTVNLTAGTYTVKVSGVAEEVLEATVTVTNERVVAINMLSTKAPLTATNAYTATVGFEVLNQYGERMPSVSVNWTQSTGVAIGSVSTGANGTGTLTLTNAGSTPFIPGAKVFLTGVNTTHAVVVNAEIEIVLPASVDAIEFIGVARNNQLTSLPAGFTAAQGYHLVFVAKDQYGNNFNLTTTTNGTITFNDVVFTSNNPLFVGTTFEAVASYTVGTQTYQAVKLVPGTAAANGGTVTIQAISARTGKVSTYTLEAGALAKLNSFSMTAPSVLVAGNDTRVEIPFVAMDQFGNSVTKFSSLNGNVTLSPAELRFVEQTDGSAKLYYYPTGNATEADALVYLTSIVPTNGNFSSVLLNVKPNAVATSIIGVKPAITTSVAAGNFVEIKGSDVVVQDQYGRNMTAVPTINVTTTKTAFTTSGSMTLTSNAALKLILTADAVVASGTSNNQTVTFTIAGEPASSRNVVFTRVAQSAYTSFEIGEIGTMYGGAVNADYNKTVKVYGVTSAGTKVQLPSSDYVLSSLTTGLGVTGSAITVTSPSSFDFGTASAPKEAKASFLVTIQDANVSGAALQILSKEVTLSGVAPKATTLTLDTDLVSAGKATLTITSGASITASAITAVVEEVVDQYGVDWMAAPSITITNVTKATGSNFAVAVNGSTAPVISGAIRGDKFTATINYGGLSTAIEFTVFVASN